MVKNSANTTRPADAEIAQAMGWRREPAYGGAALAWKNPDGIVKNLPHFHTDHAAKYTLLVWLSQQSAEMRGEFHAELNERLYQDAEKAGWQERHDWLYLLATPAQVAEAFRESIKAEE